MAGPPRISNGGSEGADSPGDFAPAFAVDGPLADTWVYTIHDPLVPLVVGGTEIVGEIIYMFSVEDGRPTLRLKTDTSRFG